MPIYEYRCSNGHVFEVFQSMSDEAVDECEVCGAPVERVFHPVAVHFKGSGFYTTDYAGKSKAATATREGGDSAGGDSGSSEKGSSSESKASGDSAGSSGSGGSSGSSSGKAKAGSSSD